MAFSNDSYWVGLARFSTSRTLPPLIFIDEKRQLQKKWASIMKLRPLYLFFTSLFCIIIFSYSIAAVYSQSTKEIRGVWLTANDTETLIDRPKLQSAIAQLASLNFNTIYPVVWNSGYALYPSAVAKQAGIQPFVHSGLQGQDPLADLIEGAHRWGMLVLPWFEFGFMAPPTSELALNHPNWLTQRRDGTQTTNSAAGEVVWLNPFHPEVQQFLTSLVMEIMERYQIDGIQFDDHLSLPVELGYDSYTVNLYQQETKQVAPSNPKDPTWMRWRANKLTAFVTQLNQAIKAKKTDAIFSISPNPYETAYNSYLQDWLDWVRNDLVDELVVQVYRSDLAVFINQISRPEITEAKQKIPTGIGVLTGLKNRPVAIEFVREKVLAAQQQNLGVVFFFFGSLWQDYSELEVERKSILKMLFINPVNRTFGNNNAPLPQLSSP
jgi:uncharacterized lipoprotein YddW (UPF0748 family)